MSLFWKIIWISYCLALLVTIVVGINYWVIKPSHYDTQCLEKIAERVCNEKNMIYNSIYITKNGFTCKEDIRSADYKRFNFLDLEMKGCRK